MELKPWTIYLWQNGDKIEGASAVVTKDGVKEIYQQGWEIEQDPEAELNEKKHQVWRAKVKVKNLLNNTLNVLNWYGKKVLNEHAEIDTEKLKTLEAINALQAIKQDKDISDLYPIQKFETKDITLEEAQELKLAWRLFYLKKKPVNF